ncbi:MAG: hypothetical protein LBS63_01065, partial [Prevotellaceae bacterium]|nr:hypothetical protein [Prevotellaceae bacterium]
MKPQRLLTLTLLLASALRLAAQGNAADWEEVQALIAPYAGEWSDAAYEGLFTSRVPHTALMGNGDIGVASGGSASSKTFYVSKGDFWAYNGSPVPVGGITIRRRGGAAGGASSLREVQDMLNAEVRTDFVAGDVRLDMRSFVSATDNVFVIAL